MDDDEQLRFEDWAHAYGLSLDERFFAERKSYLSDATQLAYETWAAAVTARDDQGGQDG